MGRSTHLALTFTAFAALAATPPAAGAQCRLCDKPPAGTEHDAPKAEVTLEIETSIRFDQLILAGVGDGSAVIRPDGTSSAHGAVMQVSPRAMVGNAVVRGEPGRALRVELPQRIVLRSFSGGEIVFEEVTTDLPSLPRLDGSGRLTFRFGGRLHVRGDAEGDYYGDLPITVEYL